MSTEEQDEEARLEELTVKAEQLESAYEREQMGVQFWPPE